MVMSSWKVPYEAHPTYHIGYAAIYLCGESMLAHTSETGGRYLYMISE